MASVQARRDKGGAARTCLRPMRADLTFQNLGTIRGMIVVDGVKNLGGGEDLYIQGVEGGFEGTFMTLYGNCRTLLGMGTSLGTPPSYYTSIYKGSNGQASVRAGGSTTGGRSAGSR